MIHCKKRLQRRIPIDSVLIALTDAITANVQFILIFERRSRTELFCSLFSIDYHLGHILIQVVVDSASAGGFLPFSWYDNNLIIMKYFTA